MSSPSLAVCLIVRDEAALLPGLLASIAPLGAEVIAVDTGSTDGTVGLLVDAGARVIPGTWTGDFAAARNVGLNVCDADWVLVLDADERLAPGAPAAILAAISGGAFDRGLLPLHNASHVDATAAAVLQGAQRRGEPTLLARLFRRGPGLRYTGALHEQVEAGWLGRPAVDAQVAADIIHLGYAADLGRADEKATRNLEILRRMCGSGGPDPVPWAYRARDAARAGLWDEARLASEAAWTRLSGCTMTPVPAAAFTLAALRADLQLQAGDVKAACETAETAAAWGPGHPSVWFLAGVAHQHLSLRATGPGAQRRHRRAARSWLERCEAHDGALFTDEVSAGATSWAAACRLGEVLLLDGDAPAAVQAFARAAARLPQPPVGLAAQVDMDVRLGLAEAALQTEGWQSALKRVEPLLALPCSDGWALAALACRNGGMMGEWTAFSDRARAVGAWRASWRRARIE